MQLSNSLKTVGVVALVGGLLVAHQFIFGDAKNWFRISGGKNAERVVASGQHATEDRGLASFTKIKIGGAYTIKLVKGPKAGIAVAGDSEVLKHITTNVNDGELQVKLDGNISMQDDILLTITYDKLEAIRLSGANELTADAPIVADKLKLRMDGASKATLAIEAQTVETDVHGAGELRLSGKVRRYEADVHGAGNIEAYELQADQVDISLSGAGHANVFAAQELEAKVSGVGNINYKGKPAKKKLKHGAMASIVEG